MDDKIQVINEEGNEVTADLVACFDIKKFDKTYVIYSYDEIDSNDLAKLYVSTVNFKDDKYTFTDVATDEEWTEIKSLMRKAAISKGEGVE